MGFQRKNISDVFPKTSYKPPSTLVPERDRRLQDLEKVNQLEAKLDAELKHLRTKIKTFTDDLGKIPDIEVARKQAEEMKQVG